MKSARFAFAAAIVLSAAARAAAHERAYVAPLSGAAESPANNSMGTGFAVVILDLDLFTMDVDVDFDGLTGNATASHIHGNTPMSLQGSADVITTVPSFPSFPTGTSGTYSHTFDLADASSYNPAFIAANGGTISLASNAFFAGLDAGTTYLNIHTTAFGGGEIRGFLLPTPKADFTHDGVVDGDDLAVWSESFLIDHEGDANDDEATDSEDFMIWQRQVGKIAGVGAGHATAVPEPPNAFMAMELLLAFAARPLFFSKCRHANRRLTFLKEYPGTRLLSPI